MESGASKNDHCWIEIGAGHGEMTEHLVLSGVPVYAIEIDPPLIHQLQNLTKRYPNLTVVPGDVLKADLRSIAAGRRIRIYGNLPYYITSPILHHLFTFAKEIDEISVLIQLEVALRLAAIPGQKDYGYLSVLTQFYSRPEFVFELPQDAFEPPPEVESALVTLRLPSRGISIGPDQAEPFFEFVKNCFAQKRKTLANNLRNLARPDRVREILLELKLREDARAEQLTVNKFAALFQAISSTPPATGPDSRT